VKHNTLISSYKGIFLDDGNGDCIGNYISENTIEVVNGAMVYGNTDGNSIWGNVAP
jgi:hypothetical protein